VWGGGGKDAPWKAWETPAAEPSGSGGFPPRLEIPPKTRDSHLSTAPTTK